jgi:mRNA interferase RelE/StbE
LAGLLRRRVGDYRMLCQLKDQELLVLVVAVVHRKDFYA